MTFYDDWAPLAERDPVPGDPDAVGGLARQLKATAVTIRGQLERLRSINSEEFWSGIAAERFKEHQEELHQPLEQQALRHERVSDALLLYAPDLGEAKRQARTALNNAREAQTAMIKAKSGLTDMDAQAKKAQADADEWNAAHPDLPPRQPDGWWGPNWHGELDTATSNLEAAKTLLRQACELRDGAASACAKKIGEAVHDGLKNKGGVFHAISRAAHDIASLPLVKNITKGVGIAAAVVGVVAIFCPILAPLAIGLAGAALALDTLAAVGGVGSWKMVAMDAIGLATMGIGRAFDSAAKGARAVEGLKVEAAVLEAGRGTPGALKGVSAVGKDGRLIYGAAARSTKLKAAADAEKDLPRFLTKAENWKQAVSPRALRDEILEGVQDVRADHLRAFSNSSKGFAADMGIASSARGASWVGQQGYVLKNIDFAVELPAAGAVAGTLGHELHGEHVDEAALHRGEAVTPLEVSAGPDV
jgi:uncharacterized protein YukE